MSSMSMPRAAMSVATSTRILPARKASSARWRAFCDLLPWMASDSMPFLARCSAHLVGAMLGAGEDDDAVHRQVLQQLDQQLALLRHGDVIELLLDAVGGLALRRDLDALGRSQHVAHQLDDIVGHGGGEQHRLPLLGQMRHDLAHIADEAHVQHAVGFVDDEAPTPRPAGYASAAPGRADGPASPPGCRRHASWH